jgi:phenylacetyl-CoA:acceptor oxidoreductase 26-kDa subunit
MMAVPVSSRIRSDLIPAVPQRLWGLPAVLNFALGGLGAGFYLAAYVATGLGASPRIALAGWLGPALVLMGFIAVAMEAGRPFRGPRVLVRIGTSWMSRELWIGGAFVALALLDRVAPHAALRLLAAVAALLLVAAQGSILRAARAIAAWSVSIMPVLFVASAAVSGAGLVLLVDVIVGRPPSTMALAGALGVVAVAFVVWLAYLQWPGDIAFARSTAPLRRGPLAAELVGVGYVAPAVLAAVALAMPAWADVATTLAAVGMIVGQIRTKTALILTAGILRPIALELTLRRRS